MLNIKYVKPQIKQVHPIKYTPVSRIIIRTRTPMLSSYLKVAAAYKAYNFPPYVFNPRH